MKFICLGYADPSKFADVPDAELSALMEECFAYDQSLRQAGHYVSGHALCAVDQAITLRHRGGRVVPTDGPYAETKEHLGGILILEADDMAHAVRLISDHPGVKIGPFEIRPANEKIHALFEAHVQATHPR